MQRAPVARPSDAELDAGIHIAAEALAQAYISSAEPDADAGPTAGEEIVRAPTKGEQRDYDATVDKFIQELSGMKIVIENAKMTGLAAAEHLMRSYFDEWELHQIYIRAKVMVGEETGRGGTANNRRGAMGCASGVRNLCAAAYEASSSGSIEHACLRPLGNVIRRHGPLLQALGSTVYSSGHDGLMYLLVLTAMRAGWLTPSQLGLPECRFGLVARMRALLGVMGWKALGAQMVHQWLNDRQRQDTAGVVQFFAPVLDDASAVLPDFLLIIGSALDEAVDGKLHGYVCKGTTKKSWGNSKEGLASDMCAASRARARSSPATHTLLACAQAPRLREFPRRDADPPQTDLGGRGPGAQAKGRSCQASGRHWGQRRHRLLPLHRRRPRGHAGRRPPRAPRVWQALPCSRICS